MAGYAIYSLQGKGFSQLTTQPTTEQAKAIAGFIQERSADSDDWLSTSSEWPSEMDALSEAVKKKLESPDWYGGLSGGDACVVDEIVWSFLEPSVAKRLRIGFKCSDYGGIYWDCAKMAASFGAEMMNEPSFGSSGFRLTADASNRRSHDPMCSIFDPAEVNNLLEQLQIVEQHFASLADDGEGGVREQFFDGLLSQVKYISKQKRYLFIQTDT